MVSLHYCDPFIPKVHSHRFIHGEACAGGGVAVIVGVLSVVAVAVVGGDDVGVVGDDVVGGNGDGARV